MQTTRPTSDRHLYELGGGGTTHPPYMFLVTIPNRHANNALLPGSWVPLLTTVVAQLDPRAAEQGDMLVTDLRITWSSEGAFDSLRPGIMDKSAAVLATSMVERIDGTMRHVDFDGVVTTWPASVFPVLVPDGIAATYSGSTAPAVPVVVDSVYVLALDDATVARLANADAGPMRFISSGMTNPSALS